MSDLLPPRWRRIARGLACVLAGMGAVTLVAWLPGPLQALAASGRWLPPSIFVGTAWLALATAAWLMTVDGRIRSARAIGVVIGVLGGDFLLDWIGISSVGLVPRLEALFAGSQAVVTIHTSPIAALSLTILGFTLAVRPVPRPGSRRDTLAGGLLLMLGLGLTATLAGRMYGPVWMYGGLVGHLPVTMLVGMLTATVLLLMAGGPGGFPVRAILGDASRSGLLGLFIPLAIFVVLVQVVVHQVLLPRVGLARDTADALLAISSVVAAVTAAFIAASLVGTATDRADATHRAALTALDDQHSLLRSILNDVPAGVIVADAGGRILLVNREGERMVGPGPHDAAPEAWPVRYGLFMPDGRTPVPAPAVPLARALRGESVDNSEAVLRSGDSTEEIRILTAARPILGPQGAVNGGLTVFVDITQRRNLELRARESQRLEAVGQLAGGVAHDFNNLLTVILGHAELLLDRMPPGDPARRSLTGMEEAARRAAVLTRRLLAFGRRQMLQPTLVDLRELLAELALPLREAVAPMLSIEILDSPEPVRVRVDRDRLAESLISLLLNAREAAMRPGLVQIALESGSWEEPRRSGTDRLPPGRWARLAIRDDGPGMPPEVLARVLEPFFTTKPKHLGAGLGLSTVYGFVRQSGGGLEITSQPGFGTTVVIWLPLAAAAEPASAGSAAAGPGSRTLLLAEDDEAIRDMIATYLEASGWTVLRATDGRDALSVAEDHPDGFGLLVTDLMMPHIGGAELARRLRERRPGLRVLYISGFTDSPPSGGDPLLPKPFSPAELLAAVTRAAG